MMTKMKSIKVAEATNAQLDWLVAKCEGAISLRFDGEFWRVLISEPGYLDYEEYLGNLNYSDDWAMMGPIIEKMFLKGMHLVGYRGRFVNDKGSVQAQLNDIVCGGSTCLVAVARLYVTTKLGNIVEVPEELV